MMLDPRRLLVFEAVVRCGSVSAAAVELHLSQPAVSRQVAALERQAGVILLERSRRGVRPTDAGRALAVSATNLQTEVRAAEATAAAYAAGEKGELRVAAFPTAAAALATPALRRLRNRHAQIRVLLVEAARADALDGLRDGSLDVAIVFEASSEHRQAAHGLRWQPLFEEPFLAALSRRHPLAQRPQIALAELRDERWIIGTAGSPTAIERACHDAGFTPEITARADDQPTIQALVAAGLGITLIPRLATGTRWYRRDIVDLPLRPPALSRRLNAVTLATTQPSVLVERFLDELAAVSEHANRALRGKESR